MSRFEDNMKDRFSDFEPEIDENTIDQNWQKLKGKLPKEDGNSKKGFLYFSIALTLFILGSVIVYYFHLTNQNQSSDKLISNNTSTKQSINSISIDTLEISNPTKTLDKTKSNTNNINHTQTSIITKENNKITKSNTSTFNYSAPAEKIKSSIIDTKSTRNKVKNEQLTNNTTSGSDKSGILLDQSNENSVKNNHFKKNQNLQHDQSKNKVNNSQLKSLEFTQSDYLKDSSDYIQKEIINSNSTVLLNNDFTIIYLPIIEYYLLPIDTHIHELKEPFAILTNTDNATTDSIKKNKFSYELFTGTNWTQSKISSSLNNENTDLKNSKLEYSFGGALNYNLSPKIMVQGQFTFNQNIINFDKNITEKVLVSNQTRVIYNPSDSANYKDTLVKYFNYNHHYNLKSMYCYNFGLGFGYTLLKKKKLFIDASVLVNLKLSKYNSERISYLETDTNQYISNSYVTNDTINYGNTVNIAYTAKEISNSVKNSSVFSMGIMPGITLGYKINDKVALIIRPSYYIDLTNGKTNIDDLKMRITQNNLFIHFGIKLKL